MYCHGTTVVLADSSSVTARLTIGVVVISSHAGHGSAIVETQRHNSKTFLGTCDLVSPQNTKVEVQLICVPSQISINITMTADKALKEIFNNIPERDQAVLLREHGITDFAKLVDKKSELQQRKLTDVCADVQMVLEVVCMYMETLDSDSIFTWEGFANFCDFNDSSGASVIDDLVEERRTKKNTQEDADPDGYNLTTEERNQMESYIEDDPLTMKIRGFSSRALQFDVDDYNKKKLVDDSSEKTEVAFNGTVYIANKCYQFQQPNGETVVVGIRKFTKVS